jgi:uncharacterized DUF497 family protein
MRWEIVDSARKHGVSDADIDHALDYARHVEDIGQDPDRWLYIGSDYAGNLLEVVVVVRGDVAVVIHAMRMRDKYEDMFWR